MVDLLTIIFDGVDRKTTSVRRPEPTYDIFTSYLKQLHVVLQDTVLELLLFLIFINEFLTSDCVGRVILFVTTVSLLWRGNVDTP